MVWRKCDGHGSGFLAVLLFLVWHGSYLPGGNIFAQKIYRNVQKKTAAGIIIPV